MNAVGIQRNNNGVGKMMVGFSYVKCEMKRTIYHLVDEEVKDVEAMITGHCLLLPFSKLDEVFEKEYALVFSDWDVGQIGSTKDLPRVCTHCFAEDVLGA